MKLSSGARFFVSEYIESAELLDVLMLLFRDPGRTWTAQQVSDAVFTVPAAAALRLDELHAHGLAQLVSASPPEYRLHIADTQTRAFVQELNDAYRANRAEVVSLVFEFNADPLKSFANAFRLRKDR
jgi:hypothetical protein